MMPPGKYYVGDLCYVMHPQWDEFCNITINANDCRDGEFNLKNGVRFATYSTYFGDGCYDDQFDGSYGVDAGLIGCILVDDISDPNANIDGGNVVEFETEFETSCDDGVIYIGHLRIDTKGADEEEEENEDDDE